MSNYTQIEDFSAKDGYTTGNPEKLILGADIDGELAAISTAIATKYDSSDIATDVQAQAMTLDDVLITPAKVKDILEDNGGMLEDIQALADPNADTLLGWDDSASAVIGWTLGDGLESTVGGAINVAMLGLEDLTDPGADRIVFWDDGGSVTAWLSPTNGIEISGTDLQLAATVAGAGLTESSGVLAVGAGSGITVNADDIALTDQASTTTNPISLTSGAFDFDITALTNIEASALPATAEVIVDDAGTPKAVELQAMGLRVQTALGDESLAAGDMNSIMEFDGTATVTIDPNSTTDLPVGVPVVLVVDHATQEVTVTAGTGVNLNSIYHPGGASAASDVVRAGGTAVLVQLATDDWYLSGDIKNS